MRRRTRTLLTGILSLVLAGGALFALTRAPGGAQEPADEAAAEATAPRSNSDVIMVGEARPRLLFLSTTDSLVQAGYFHPGRPFPIAQTSLATGRYVVGYSFEVRHSGWPSSAATLECALVEAESGIQIEPQESTSVSATDGWTSLEFGMRVDLPSMTVAVHCAPTTPGITQSEFEGISLFALRVS